MAGLPHCCSIAPLYADVLWPALFLEKQILSVIPITADLIVEWLALWFGFGLSWKKAAVVDVVMNAVSTGAGVYLIPVLGLPVGIVFPGFGLFSPASWAATFMIAVFGSTAIEAAIVRWGFKVPLGTRRFWILCAANCASIAVACASLRMSYLRRGHF